MFDWRYGTNTSVRVAKDDQTIDASNTESDDGLLYVASFTSVVRDSLLAVRRHLGEEFYLKSQFVDLGCGKGKTLLLFSLKYRAGNTLPALGIEYDPELTEIARRNVTKCGLSEDEVVLHTASAVDVRNYTDSDSFIFYLYNSFQGETLRAFLAAISDLPHCIIYVDPVERETLIRDFDYRLLEDTVGKFPANTWLMAASPKVSA